MLPTLKPGQDVLVWCWFYTPKVGDIVAIKVTSKEMIKRVRKVFDREVIVQGDNERESTDSRKFGPVKRYQIIGKVVWSG
ncbi:S26 family signal peptidase [Candidatus Daviesbacteria bacterium]|nr:S26 family signal peptidase [Candidatus Daviesbacteria bacterium]